MNRLPLLLAAVLGVAWPGVACSLAAGDKDKKLPDEVTKVLEAAAQIEVVSVDPGDGKNDRKELGSTIVKDAKRKQVLDALYKSVARGGSPAKCFEPRHILRATSEGKSVTLVICFQCSQMQVSVGKAGPQTIVISDAAHPVLDQILKDAGVPLPSR
jgi:hypothetical protein